MRKPLSFFIFPHAAECCPVIQSKVICRCNICRGFFNFVYLIRLSISLLVCLYQAKSLLTLLGYLEFFYHRLVWMIARAFFIEKPQIEFWFFVDAFVERPVEVGKLLLFYLAPKVLIFRLLHEYGDILINFCHNLFGCFKIILLGLVNIVEVV